MAKKATGKYDINKLCKLLNEYTEATDIPILKECCLNNNLSYDYISQLKRKEIEENPNILDRPLTLAIKRLLDKKEVSLEKMALNGKIDRGMAIFSLKQIGWKDNPTIEDDTKNIVGAVNTLIQTMANNTAPTRKTEDFE